MSSLNNKDISSLNNKDMSFDFLLFQGYSGNYSIDPITLPLLISLGEQLKRYHKNTPIKLNFASTSFVQEVLDFLNETDFFHVIGKNSNPLYPIGRDIFDFNVNNLDTLSGKKFRPNHKIRGYSILEDDLYNILNSFEKDDDRRDYLIEYYTFKVQNHFLDLLEDKIHTNNLKNDFVEILSELITNGVLHSHSNVYALMFSDRFKTKFSISDNGIGLYESLNNKLDTNIYSKFKLYKVLMSEMTILCSDSQKESLFAIFETLYYSMLKDRRGLFDLISKVIIDCNGYFRLHNDNAQIIISNRMYNELIPLLQIRKKILDIHNHYGYHNLIDKEYKVKLMPLLEVGFQSFLVFSKTVIEKYNVDVKFSSVRFYQVKFKGVHIEVEIPNIN